MKYSYNWLKELSGTKKSVEEVAELFLTHSFEVEGIEDLSRGLDKVVVGEVLEVKKHPDADRLNIAKVKVSTISQSQNNADLTQTDAENIRNDVKSDEILQIVCGAPNLEVGQKVPVALVGAKLPLPAGNGKSKVESKKSKVESGAREEFFEIKQSKIRGVESFGMICAEDELGLGDDHEGIMVLTASQSQTNANDRKTPQNLRSSDFDPLYTGGEDGDGQNCTGDEPIVGQNFAEYLHLDDKILDIDILPNRGHDCLGYNGVAGELAALENIKFKEISHKIQDTNKFQISKFKFQNADNFLDVKIETENCSRYAGVRIKNIKIKPSPIWIQARLKASGMKPINNVVDITNYVMLETGQPLHAFGSQKLKVESKKCQIVVRQAEEGEKIVLLDEQELELSKDDIVITDGKKPVALAGVMGGLDSGVQDDTTEIILEGANFNSSSIRFTARRYNLQTDAAYRFERDIDPNFIDIAISRAVELLQELADGEAVEAVDIYPEPVKPWVINLDADYVRRLLGVDISEGEIKRILESLQIRCSLNVERLDNIKTPQNSRPSNFDPLYTGGVLDCTIPTARRDLRIQEDLIEEVGRIYGYDNIRPKPLKENVRTPHRNEQRFFERNIKEMAVHRGFSEIRGYSFYNHKDAQALGVSNLKHIELLNPASPEQAILRNTLVVDLLKAGRKNLSYYKEVRIFEIGKIYKDIEEVLPREELFFSGLVTYKGEKGEQFYEAKGLIDSILESLGLNDFYYDSEFSEEEESSLLNLHPSRRALLKDERGEVFGWLGEVDKKANKYFGLKKMRGAIWEIDVDKLREKLFSNIAFEPLAKFPFMERDLSMKVGDRLKVKEVEDVLFKAGGELIQDVDLFDLYLNKETGERSMAFHLVFGDKNKTLTTEEVDKAMAIIIKIVEEELEVEVKR